MRERHEVLEKYTELRDRYLRERKERFLGRQPINCASNIRVRVKGKGQIGLCNNPLVRSRCGNGKMFVCNDDATCARCRLFVCKNTEKSVESDFDDILKSPSRVGNDYPKLAMLIWFLQEHVSTNRKERFRQVCKSLLFTLRNLSYYF